MTWYNTLIKPTLNPPSWIFPPVWTILYLIILVSFILFVRSDSTQSKVLPLVFFFIQLVLNLSWSPIFFNFNNIKLALWVVCLLWIFLLGTIITFYPHSKLASLLLVPYLLWVSFATYLNAEILRLNSGY